MPRIILLEPEAVYSLQQSEAALTPQAIDPAAVTLDDLTVRLDYALEAIDDLGRRMELQRQVIERLIGILGS